MPQQREDPVGVLVIRASVEDLDAVRLLVQIVEVNPPLPDRNVGIVSTAQAAVALVGEWLDSLVEQSARGRPVSGGAGLHTDDAGVTPT